MAGDDWVVVYRGFAVSALDMVQTMLSAEGLEPRRLGNASPALMGVGDWAVEQLIEVPRGHEQAARALIAASPPASGEDPQQSADLEAEALSAGRAPANVAAQPERGGFSALIIALIVAVTVVLFFVLR